VKLWRLPTTAHVPLIVTLFMIAVSTFASERVLSRLIETQTRQVQALADVYVDGLALALVDSIIREDVWQIFDVLDRSRQRPGEIRPAETIVAGMDGNVIASSDPVRIPTQSPVPAQYVDSLRRPGRIAIAEDEQRAYVRREVLYENLRIGSIYSALDIAPLLTERREVLWTLILTNVVLTIALAGAAWLIVSHMMKPMRLLTDHLERSHAGQLTPIPDSVLGRLARDHRRPFEALNRLAAAVAEREALSVRLAEEERLASLGRLASGMAHEINNPLGGLFNAIDTMKRHGADIEVRRATIDLVERGLRGIRDVVRAALMSYRAERDDRPLKPEDIEDLRLLIQPEARRRDVVLRWQNELAAEVSVRATAMRQIILNLVLNACQATPQNGWVVATFVQTADAVILTIDDEGPGMPAAAGSILTGTTGVAAPIGKGTGLGLWMANRLIRELEGSVSIERKSEAGTRVVVTIPVHQELELSHVA
jgi:two-component system, OmpR family, sensor kinase